MESARQEVQCSGSNVAVRMWRVLLNLGEFAESRRCCWVGADGWTHIPAFVLLRSDTGMQPMSRSRANGAACRCLANCARARLKKNAVEAYFPVSFTGDKLIGYGKVRAERACSVARYLHVFGVISSPTRLELPNQVNWKFVSDVWIDCTVGLGASR